MTPRHTEDDFGLTLLMQSFHQDWTNLGSGIDVLAETLWAEQDPLEVQSLYSDVACVSQNLDDSEARLLWLACTDGPPPFDARDGAVLQWLTVVADRASDWLSQRGFGAETTDGIEPRFRADDVLAEIQQLPASAPAHYRPEPDSGWDQISAALIRCAESCYPDLAFRLLLRIICNNGVAISGHYYSRLLTKGRALGFGEFLVARAQPFVVN